MEDDWRECGGSLDNLSVRDEVEGSQRRSRRQLEGNQNADRGIVNW